MPVPRRASERIATEEPVEVPAGRFSQVKARHARAPAVTAAGIEWAPMIAAPDVVHEVIEFSLEHRLEAAEHEIAPCRCIHEEAEMRRDKQLGKRAAVYA